VAPIPSLRGRPAEEVLVEHLSGAAVDEHARARSSHVAMAFS
jgi:hypothetical protein